MDVTSKLAPRQAAEYDGMQQRLIIVFISLQLFGFFGAIFMLASALLLRSAPRHPTWISFICSWIISTFSYTILFFSGQLTQPHPVWDVCVIQAFLIYSVPPFTAATTSALAIQIWFVVRSIVTSDSIGFDTVPRKWTILLLVAPYLIFAPVLIVLFIVGTRNPGLVVRQASGMYCGFSSRTPGRFSALVVVFIMLVTVAVEVHTFIALRKSWTLFKYKKTSLSMIIRVTIFTCFGILAVILGIIFFFGTENASSVNITLSLLPVAVVLVFGTQADLFRAWVCWRSRLNPVTDDQSVSFLQDPEVKSPRRMTID